MAFLKRIWIRVSRCGLDLADQTYTQGTETPTGGEGHMTASLAVASSKCGY